MNLIEIEYGALASSEVMNNNFNYLDNKSSVLSETIDANVATITSNIATLNTAFTNFSNTTNSEISDLKNAWNNPSLLFVSTYINGASWYKEYFSDSAKTKRVWLEQGGRCSVTENDKRYMNLVFLKPFSNNDYTITLAGVSASMSNSDFGHIYSLTNTGVRFNSATVSNPIIWHACGV